MNGWRGLAAVALTVSLLVTPSWSGYQGEYFHGAGGGTGSGVASGGLPAAYLPEDGDTTGKKGLFLGLKREGAGADWRLVTSTRDLGTQAHVTIGSGANTLRITLPRAFAVGAAGNDWRFHIVAGTDYTAYRQNVSPRVWIVSVPSNPTLGGVRDALNAAVSGSAVLTGSASAALGTRSLTVDFEGGIGPSVIAATADEATKTVNLSYHATDTLQTLLNAAPVDLGVNAELVMVGISGSDLTASPVAPEGDPIPFDRYFSQGSLPDDTPDLTITGTFAMDGTQLNLTLSNGRTAQIPTPASLRGGTDAVQGTFASDGTYLDLTTVTANGPQTARVTVPAVLRQSGGGTSLTDAQIGDKAFSNPPSDLTNTEQQAVRTAIGAGTGSGSTTPSNPTISFKTGNYQILSTDKGSTIVYSGTAAARFTLPLLVGTGSALSSSQVEEIGWEVCAVNLSSAVLTVGTTSGQRSNVPTSLGTSAALKNDEAVCFQSAQNDDREEWITVADTIQIDTSTLVFRDQEVTFSEDVVFNNQAPKTSEAPTDNDDLTRKDYVDSQVNTVRNQPPVVQAWTSGLNPSVGQLVRHTDGVIYMCTATVSAGNRNIGPNGLPNNYVALNLFRGTWSRGWYAPGSMVLQTVSSELHIYVANQAVANDATAPNANAKWTRIDGGGTSGGSGLDQAAVDARIRALVADQAEEGNTSRWALNKIPTALDLLAYLDDEIGNAHWRNNYRTVVTLTGNRTLLSSDVGKTFRLTGTSALTVTMPAIGVGDVTVGYWATFINDTNREQAITPGSGDGIEGAGGTTRVLPVGVAVTLQAVSDSLWADIADTEQGSGSGGLSEAQVDARVNTLVPVKMTTAERTKLGSVATGAEVNVNPDWNASSGDAQILNKPTIPAAPASNRLIPPGGTTGQAIVKRSGTNYDAGWGTITGSGTSVVPNPTNTQVGYLPEVQSDLSVAWQPPYSASPLTTDLGRHPFQVRYRNLPYNATQYANNSFSDLGVMFNHADTSQATELKFRMVGNDYTLVQNHLRVGELFEVFDFEIVGGHQVPVKRWYGTVSIVEQVGSGNDRYRVAFATAGRTRYRFADQAVLSFQLEGPLTDRLMPDPADPVGGADSVDTGKAAIVQTDGTYGLAPPFTDAQIGVKAFSNPPNDLTSSEQEAVRTAIGAGTGTGTGVDQTARNAADAAQTLAEQRARLSLVPAAVNGIDDAVRNYTLYISGIQDDAITHYEIRANGHTIRSRSAVPTGQHYYLPATISSSDLTAIKAVDSSAIQFTVVYFAAAGALEPIRATVGEYLGLSVLDAPADITVRTISSRSAAQIDGTAFTLNAGEHWFEMNADRQIVQILLDTIADGSAHIVEFERDDQPRTVTLTRSGRTITLSASRHISVLTIRGFTIGGSSGSTSSGLTQTDADARYLRLSGGTMTGALTLSGAPTADSHAATKAYVDANGGSATVTDDSILDAAADVRTSAYRNRTLGVDDDVNALIFRERGFVRVPVPAASNRRFNFSVFGSGGQSSRSTPGVAGGIYYYDYRDAHMRQFDIDPNGGEYTVSLADLVYLNDPTFSSGTSTRIDPDNLRADIDGTTFMIVNVGDADGDEIVFAGGGLATILPTGAVIAPGYGALITINPTEPSPGEGRFQLFVASFKEGYQEGEITVFTSNRSVGDDERWGNVYTKTGSATATLTLPLLTARSHISRHLSVVNTGTGTLTVARRGSATIEGQTSLTLDQYESVRLMAVSNVSWAIIADTRGGYQTPRRVGAKPASLSEGEVVFVTTGSDKGWWTAGSDGVPYAAEIRRKPNVLLTANVARTTEDHILPTNFTDWQFVYIVTDDDGHSLPTAALGSGDRSLGDYGYWEGPTRTLTGTGGIDYLELR